MRMFIRAVDRLSEALGITAMLLLASAVLAAAVRAMFKSPSEQPETTEKPAPSPPSAPVEKLETAEED